MNTQCGIAASSDRFPSIFSQAVRTANCLVSEVFDVLDDCCHAKQASSIRISKKFATWPIWPIVGKDYGKTGVPL